MHRGQLVEEATRRSGMSLTKVALRLGISRRTLYQWFTYDALSLSKVERIGAVINHDFSQELTELSNFVNEHEYKYGSAMPPDYKKILLERDKYLKMYHDLIDKHTKALEKIVQLQEEVSTLKLELNQIKK